MKRLSILAATCMALAIVGCKPSSQKADQNADSADSTVTSNVNSEPDSTMYGTYVDGGMSAFDMKCDDDSTRSFIIENDSNVVFGGFAQGDQMAVNYTKNGLGEYIVTKVIDLTTLQATWTSLDKNFEIKKGGEVQSHQQGETQPWTSWRIFNGHLILNKDTFDIDRLDGDSLFLENKEGIFEYARAK